MTLVLDQRPGTPADVRILESPLGQFRLLHTKTENPLSARGQPGVHAQTFIINRVQGRSDPKAIPHWPSPCILFCIRLSSASAKYPETVLSRTAVPLTSVQLHDKFMKMQRT